MAVPWRFRLIAWPSVALFLAMGLSRLAFLAWFGEPAAGRAKEALEALLLGLRFDARMTALLALPAVLLLREGVARVDGDGDGSRRGRTLLRLALCSQAVGLLVFAAGLASLTHDVPESRPFLLAFLAWALVDRFAFSWNGLKTQRPMAWLWGSYAAVCGALALAAFAVDVAVYSWTRTRLSGMLLLLLADGRVNARVAWESYPVVRVGLALGLVLVAGLGALRRLASRPVAAGVSRQRRRAFDGLLAAVVLVSIWGSFTPERLSWQDARTGGDGFFASLALNPLLCFLETKRSGEARYDLEAVRASRPLLAERLGAPLPGQGPDGMPTLRRVLEPRSQVPPGSRPNVVLVHLESLAAFKMGLFGNPAGATPFLDGLLRRSLLFDRAYAVGDNTARAFFPLLYGIADVTPAFSSTRNPLAVEQETLVDALEGYGRYYFTGGAPDYCGIRASLASSIRGLVTNGEDDIPSPRRTVWGVSDADLLREVDRRLRTIPEPFFALVQTAGNHLPFDVPGDVPGFARRPLRAEELSAGQFESQEEYDSLRFLDFCLERFFHEAERSSYFASTVFVLYGDHGVVRGARDQRFGAVPLELYHVPLAFFGPAYFPEGRRIPTLASQVDLLPTLVSLLGLRASYQGLGRDLFDPASEGLSAPFTFRVSGNATVVGLRQESFYLVASTDGTTALFRVDDPEGRDVSRRWPERTREMAAVARATREWSAFLLTHNRPAGSRP